MVSQPKKRPKCRPKHGVGGRLPRTNGSGVLPEHRKRPRDPNQLAKSIIDIATGATEDRPPTPEEQGKDPNAASLGRKGGKARAESLSAKKRSEIAKQAARKRWE